MNSLRLKRIAKSVREPANSGGYVGLEQVEGGTGRLIEVDSETEPVSAVKFRTGDVLYGKLRPYLRKVLAATFSGRCSSEFLVLRPTSVEPRFLSYVLLSNQVTDWCVINSDGAKMPRTEWNVVGKVVVPVPDASRQRAIADYLDRETARIDTLIEKKQSLLILLAEKRRTLITRAVTRGLVPGVPFRDPGIPWLGLIPAHWEVRRLKHVGRAILGLTFDPADAVADGNGILVLRAGNVYGGKIVLEDNLFVLVDITDTLRTAVGDILICSRSGSRALIGKNAMIDQASAGLTFGAFMTVFRSPYNDYLYYVFNSPLFDFQAGAYSTATINQLTIDTLNGIEVPLPPQQEQRAIAASLRNSTSRLDRIVDAIEATLTLLRSRRQALITAAVTGQIEIPGAA